MTEYPSLSPRDPSPDFVPLTSGDRGANNMMTPLSSPISVSTVKYLVTTLLLLFACIIDFSLPYWFRYCRSDVSLTGFGDDGYSVTFNEFVKQCDNDWIYGKERCGGICDKIKQLRSVGDLMLALGTLSMVALVVAMIRLLIFTVNPSRAYGQKLIVWALIIAAVLWCVATFVYIGVYANIVSDTDDNTHMEGGVPLAIVIAAWHIISCFFGIKVTKKIIER